MSGDGTGWKDKGFNIGFNHNIPKAKVDLYAGVHGNTLDTPTGISDVDDIYTFVVGTLEAEVRLSVQALIDLHLLASVEGLPLSGEAHKWGNNAFFIATVAQVQQAATL